MSDETIPRHSETFEIVLLKDGANQMTAKVEDFKRIPVEAESPIHALISDAAKESGWTAVYATKPGSMTEPEVLARRRSMDQGTCRVCLQTECVCK